MGILHVILIALIAMAVTSVALVGTPAKIAVAPAPETPAAGESPATEEPQAAQQKPEPQTEAKAPVAVPEQAPHKDAEPALSDAELNATARGALVNVFCTTQSGGAQKP
ncbi:MAG: hypothetical protein AAB964_00210, partial [Patescibacteria group bacterium]